MSVRAKAIGNAPTSKLESHSRFTTKARQQQQSTSSRSASSSSASIQKKQSSSGTATTIKSQSKKSSTVAAATSVSSSTVSNSKNKQRSKAAKVHRRDVASDEDVDDDESDDDDDEEEKVKAKKRQKVEEGKKEERVEEDIVQRIKLAKSDPDYIRISKDFLQSAPSVFRLVSIERVVNTPLQRRFDEANREFAKKGHHSAKIIHEGWHSTPTRNVASIVQHGLLIAKVGSQGGSDFGKGIYMGAASSTALNYAHISFTTGIGSVLIFDILPARSHSIRDSTSNYIGARCQPGYDSHFIESGIYVLFQEKQAQLRYILTFEDTTRGDGNEGSDDSDDSDDD